MGLEEDKILYLDYACRNDPDTHMYIHRVKRDDEKIHQLKVRITEPDGTKLCCKILYDKNLAEVWTGSSTDDSNRIQIGNVFDIDFSDLDKLKQKIRMYMLFS